MVFVFGEIINFPELIIDVEAVNNRNEYKAQNPKIKDQSVYIFMKQTLSYILSFCLLLPSTLLLAQQREQQIKIGTAEVQLDLVIKDKKGRPSKTSKLAMLKSTKTALSNLSNRFVW